ncbi:hypothetical protein [Companilactobacillus sp. HBUAS56257]|uniref:hypothetical protein n=1 Tax=Companilactobacillus sp. HBUAS56257 TaxID=3109360 RepID=UPI002FEFE1FC
MGLKITGIDEFSEKLNSLSKNAERLDGTHKVEFKDLFNDSFMIGNTKYKTMNDFFDAVGVTDADSFKELPDEILDAHVSKNTKFSNWQEMQIAASKEYTLSKLGF